MTACHFSQFACSWRCKVESLRVRMFWSVEGRGTREPYPPPVSSLNLMAVSWGRLVWSHDGKLSGRFRSPLIRDCRLLCQECYIPLQYSVLGAGEEMDTRQLFSIFFLFWFWRSYCVAQASQDFLHSSGWPQTYGSSVYRHMCNSSTWKAETDSEIKVIPGCPVSKDQKKWEGAVWCWDWTQDLVHMLSWSSMYF